MRWGSTLFVSILLSSCNQINFHRIGDPKDTPAAYRSAQLNPYDLRSYVTRHRIDTIVNFWGFQTDPKIEYILEKQITYELGIEYHEFLIRAQSQYPSKKIVLILIDIIETAKLENRVILFHCRAGFDRSGFGGALAKLILHNKSVVNALTMLSPNYGYSCFERCLFKEFIQAYQPFEHHLSLKEWVMQHYSPEGGGVGQYQPPSIK